MSLEHHKKHVAVDELESLLKDNKDALDSGFSSRNRYSWSMCKYCNVAGVNRQYVSVEIEQVKNRR